MGDLVERLRILQRFLAGAGEIDGLWFGDTKRLPGGRGRLTPFWWRRSHLPVIDEAADLITAQAAQIEGLRKALEPFAAYADPHGAFPADLPITSGSSMARKQLTMGDCYNAAEALSQFKGKE